MKEYPWNSSRKKIKQFLEEEKEWRLDLPEELTDGDILKLYERNSPVEFVPYDILTECIDHKNCPEKVMNDAFEKLIQTKNDIDTCLAALALRSELSAEKLEKLAVLHFHEECGEHAVGTLVTKALNGCKKSRKILKSILKQDFSKSGNNILKYISDMITKKI